MVLEDGEDLRHIDKNIRLIAVIMPNDMTVGQDWSRYRVPVKEVEKLTGYRFFSKVPAKTIEPLKAKVDEEHIPKPRAIHHGSEN